MTLVALGEPGVFVPFQYLQYPLHLPQSHFIYPLYIFPYLSILIWNDEVGVTNEGWLLIEVLIIRLHNTKGHN